VRIADGAEALELPLDLPGSSGISIYPLVLWSEADGITLVDAGVPGQLRVFEQALARLGLALRDLRRILLTHQDLDHIGSAAALSEATGAEVWAHAADAPYIRGDLPLLKLDVKKIEARIAALPEERRAHAQKMLSSPPRVTVHHSLSGGEELPFHGGITVIPTPGHTPGHACYYVKALQLLAAGDALRVENGGLIGPNPIATADMRRAVASLRNLLPCRVTTVLCYHGGLATRDVAARIQALARIAT
jgi:glyoxylase-like metal-dependent hydrolase (beta-lactamase superfamily II)